MDNNLIVALILWTLAVAYLGYMFGFGKGKMDTIDAWAREREKAQASVEEDAS